MKKKTNKSSQLNTPQSNPGLLTRRQVAGQLQTCPHSVARYTERGLLPAVVINSRVVRYRPEDVERFIESALVGLEKLP